MKTFTFLAIILIMAGCKKGDLKAPLVKACSDTLQHDVISVSGPTTTQLNQEATFNLQWVAQNSCDSFYGFIQDTTSNIISVKTFATHDSCNVCTLTAPTSKPATFKFKPLIKGTYYLKFLRSAGNSITDTLVVN